MLNQQEKPQWRMGVIVYHGRDFGHRLELETQRQGQATRFTSLGSWKGLGIPESVLNEASALVMACLTEHLVTRYGVQGEIDFRRGGEPEPF